MSTTATTRRTRVALELLLVAAFAFALASCGGDDDDTAATEPSPTGASAATDETTADGTAADETVAAGTVADETTADGTAADETVADNTPIVPGVTVAADGVVFSPPDGAYTLVYPSEPTQNDQTVPLPDGTTLPVTFYILDAGETALGSASVEYPAGTEVSLEGSQEGAIANISATLIDSEPITLQGREGLQFSADVRGQGTYLSRIYADGATLYQVIAIETGEASFDDPDVAAFFDSFQFTEDG